MQDYIWFISNHWALVALFLFILLVIIGYELLSSAGGGAKLSPQEVVQKINREEAIVVDVRSHALFEKGHLTGALSVPLADITKKQIKKIEKFKKSPVILVCDYGQHSNMAAQKLKQEGFENVYLLQGGLQAWQSASLPLVKD